jgi:tetratricopeptide (TPR) repeat protein
MQSAETEHTTRSLRCRIVEIAGVFLLVAIPLVYFPDSIRPFLWPKLLVAQLGVLLIACTWVLHCWDTRTSQRWCSLDLPVIAYFLVVALSLPLAINSHKSSLEIVKLFTFIVLYFSVSRTLNPSCVLSWAYTICIVGGVVSIIGIAQSLGIEFLWIPTGGPPSATFLYRNFAAMYLIMVIPFALVLFFYARNLKAEAVFGLVCTLTLVFLIYTRTRGAWVGFSGAVVLSVGLTFWAIRHGTWPFLRGIPLQTLRKLLVGMCISILVVAAVQITPGMLNQVGVAIPVGKVGVMETAASIVEGQHSGRLQMWKHTLDLIRDNWLKGTGIGNWELVYPKYALGVDLHPGWTFLRPHNDYLWIASELGMVGLLIYLWLLITAFRVINKTLRKTDNALLGLVVIAAGISLVAISGHAFFSFPRERIPPTFQFWLMLGIVSGTASMGEDGRTGGISRKISRVYFPALTVFLLVASSYPVYRALMADRAHYQVVLAQAQKNWKLMRAKATDSIEWGVRDYTIFFLKARACLALGDYSGAIEASQRCLDYHPNSMTAYRNIGKLSARLGSLEKANEAFAKALELDPDNGELYHDYGLVQARMGKNGEAFHAYSVAIERGADSAILRFNRGGLYRKTGQLDSSMADYLKVVGLDPGFYQAHLAIGGLHQIFGAPDSAMVAYQRTIELNSEFPEPYYSLGGLYLKKGETQEAVKSYKIFLTLWKGDSKISERIKRLLSTLGK